VNTQDTELVIRALQGDKEAFGKLVDKYQGAVYGLCFHLVGNFADAQDLAQEALVRAYLDLHQLREPSKFASWLYRVTMNVCKMWLRKRKADFASLDTVAPTEFLSALPSPQEIVERKELQLAVRRAINSLSEKNRLTVTLYYMDGLSYQEISDFLGVPVTTVKSRLHKARLQLKEELITMVEKTFEEQKLPEDFAEKVLQEVSVARITFETTKVKDLEGKEELRKTPVLHLANKADEKEILPIWIGEAEGHAISTKLQGKESPRPMTHDLMANILQAFGMKLAKVVVSEIRETTFIAKLVIESNGVAKEIDARPSDSVALALRMNAPIFVAQDVLTKSGVKVAGSPEAQQ
jgi:RNA polymerase sigma-70 factor (ECF subfamily)